jgi:hypothetical protein
VAALMTLPSASSSLLMVAASPTARPAVGLPRTPSLPAHASTVAYHGDAGRQMCGRRGMRRPLAYCRSWALRSKKHYGLGLLNKP